MLHLEEDVVHKHQQFSHRPKIEINWRCTYGSRVSQQPQLPFNIPDYPPYLLQPTTTFLTNLHICYSLLQHSWLTSVFATAYYKAYGSHVSQQPLLPFNIPDYPLYLLQPTTTFLTTLRICYSLIQCIWQPCFSATSTAPHHLTLQTNWTTFSVSLWDVYKHTMPLAIW